MRYHTVIIAYALHKFPHVFPVIGGPKVKQLSANIKASEIYLSSEQISYLESSVVYNPVHVPSVNKRFS